MTRLTDTTAPRRPGLRRGLSIAELMIALAITAMLLSAIAAAYVSSSQVIEINDRFFRATQGARVALTQMLTEVRRCDSIPITTVPGTPYKISSTILPILRPDDAPKQPNEALRVYQYDSANKRIVLFFRYLDNTESARYPIASNVQASPFSWDEGKDSNNSDCVVRVSVDLHVSVNNQSVHLTGSAAPRRSLTFK
jgi:type II secretory pathway pseudopilin PulG